MNTESRSMNGLLMGQPKGALRRRRSLLSGLWPTMWVLLALVGLTTQGRAQTFTYDHTEAVVSASMNADGGTTDVPSANYRNIGLHVDATSWEIWVDENGNTESRNYNSNAAYGASVAYSVTSGDGYVVNGTGIVDGNGNSSEVFYMGSYASTMQAVVTFGDFSAVATLNFTPYVGEVFTYNHSESSLGLTLTAVGGATDLYSGDQRQVQASVQYLTWEVWTSEWGNSQIRNNTSSPAYGAAVTFGITSGDGSLSSTSESTDGSGIATTTFTMGSEVSHLEAYATFADQSASSALDFLQGPTEPVFHYDHTEPTITTYLGTSEGTTGVPSANYRNIAYHIEASTWEIWVDQYGNSETRNHNPNAAVGATVYYSVTYGDGYVVNGSGTVDSNGNSAEVFYMGSYACGMQAVVSFGGFTAVATLDFTPYVGETYYYNHTENSLAITLSTTGGTNNLATGDQRSLQAVAQLSTWEVWTSEWGNSQTRNFTSGPASGLPVSFYLTSGDGSLSSATETTDSSGAAGTTFTMGSGTSHVVAYITLPDASAGATAELEFSLAPPEPVFNYDHTEATITASMNADGGTTDVPSANYRNIGLHVDATTWEIWVDQYGNSETRNYNSSAANGASVAYSVTYGDGYVVNGSGTVDSNGNSSEVFYMGSYASGLRADISFGGFSAVATLDFTPYVYVGEVFNYDHSESSLAMTLEAIGGGTDLTTGDQRQVEAVVQVTTWEVWTSNWGNSQIVNVSASGASGATVTFNVTSGDGMLSSGSESTDGYGAASSTFTMGSSSSHVEVYATFGMTSTSGALDFSLVSP